MSLVKLVPVRVLTSLLVHTHPYDTHKRFAPLSLPSHRRLQTAAVLFWGLLLPLCLSLFFLLW